MKGHKACPICAKDTFFV